MKRLILILIVSFQASTLFCQEDSVKVEKLYLYCELAGSYNSTGTKMEVWINHGEPVTRETKPVIFNSMIEAMNTMSKQGWVLVAAYAVPVASRSVHYYILRKEVTIDI